MFEEQSAPQTMGDRQGLRQLTLDNNSTKLQITTEGMVAFSLSHFDDAQFNYDVFYGGKHPYDLVRSNQISLTSISGSVASVTAVVVATLVCHST